MIAKNVLNSAGFSRLM